MSKFSPEWIPPEYSFWPDYSELDNSIWKSFCVPWLVREKTMLDLGKYPSSLQGAECFSPFWPRCCWTLLQPEFIATNWKQLANWKLRSIHAGIRWPIPFPERHRSEALSRQAQPTKGMKQSRFHQLQLIETALPRRKNIIVHHINLHFLCMSVDLSATDPSRLM